MNLETPIQPQGYGCQTCAEQHAVLPMDAVIAVGFGYAALEKDGIPIFTEQDRDEFMTVAEAEALAVAEPDSDWRIHLVGPLRERHFQRQGPGKWVLYQEGKGFA